MHSAISKGERLWLFTRIALHNRSEYRLLACLEITHKTINAPGYPYGPYRLWGDTARSRYFRLTEDPRDDVFELLRLLPIHGIGLADKNRSTLAQACQTIRGLTPKASKLLELNSSNFAEEPRAKSVPDEERLEKALYAVEPTQLDLMLNDAASPYSPLFKRKLRESQSRNRALVEQLVVLYQGRCQVTGHDSPVLYGVATAEAHHVVYRSRGGEDIFENMVLLSPNLHRAIHAAEARFDYDTLSFLFSNGRVEPLAINRHLTRRHAPTS